MAIAVVSNTGVGSPDSNTVTTPAINTTGASLVVVGVSDYEQAAIGTLSDSKTNTWVPRTTYSAVGSRAKLYYAAAGTFGTSHTFTYTITGGFPVVCVLALSGTHTTPYDVENGAAQTSGASIATGSITPSENDAILITMYMSNDSFSGVTVDSGFTVANFVNRVAGQCFEGALAYLIQTTAAAKNPTWTIGDSSVYSAAAVASFKVAASGATMAARAGALYRRRRGAG